MKRLMSNTLAAGLLLTLSQPAAVAQHPDVTLHVNPRWKSCAFQLDPSLTQEAWRQFTRELGVVSYFRPLTDARPMGAMRFELAIVQWQTGIDETTDAWNDTFVHPDATHWLTDGQPLAIPGLMVRGGITDRIDVGAYVTKNVESNYGLWGAQLQYNVLNDPRRQLAASARLSLVSLFGPEDVDLTVYGMDVLVSKTFDVVKWVSFSPYVGASTVLARSHERSAAVNLGDETTLGVMGTIGAVTQVSVGRLAVEYTVAEVNSLSFKVGVGF